MLGQESGGSFQTTIATLPRLDAGSRTATTTTATCVANATATAIHAVDPGNPLKKSVKDPVAKVRNGANDTVGKVEQAGKEAKDHDKDNASKGNAAKTSGQAAA